MNKKQLVLLGLSIGLMGIAQSAEALKFGPRIGLYSESFDDGSCYKEKEFGLQLGLMLNRHPRKECHSGNCGQIAPAPAPMPVAMPMPVPVMRPAIQYLAAPQPIQIIQQPATVTAQPQQLPQLKTTQPSTQDKKNVYVMVMPPKDTKATINNTDSTTLPVINQPSSQPVNLPTYQPQEISQLPPAPMPSPMYDNSQIRGLW